MEILVALFIFSIIVTTVFGSYRFVFSGNEAISDTLQMEEMAQICLERMVRDLRAVQITPHPAAPSSETDGPADPFRFEGDRVSVAGQTFSRIRFTSIEHLSAKPDREVGIAEIVYYVTAEADDEGTFLYVLRRSDRLDHQEPFEENRSDPILCESVKAFTATYIDGKGLTQEDWDSDSDDYHRATPRVVDIRLELATASVSRRYRTAAYLPIHRESATE